MKHKIISRSVFDLTFELVNIELIPENNDERIFIKTHSNEIENYLIFNLNAVDVIEDKCPFFKIKITKMNIGIGK